MTKTIENILFINQARLSSKRLPRKMLLPFAGTTLVDICLPKIKQSIIPKQNFYFSVYEPELINIGKDHGVQIWERGKRSADSEGENVKEIYSWHDLAYEYVILISACNPLLSVSTINRFIEKFLSCSFPSLFSVVEHKDYFWNEEGRCINKMEKPVMCTKSVGSTYQAAHCLYASPMSLLSEGKFLGDFSPGNPALYIIPSNEFCDIDTEIDFKRAEMLYKLESNK